ncbi:hypothetical protein ACKZDW_04175 (plasmid) [Ralstonia syzygii subsp. celebesensis]|uniref:Uncharacterized protein n=2 Tax=Ralstonia syzygii subsp. celebesensis TaxID=1310168 RepID=A0A1U9VRA1_9RALS|nr:hypothetical protein [Ralstonia syzygii]AQW32697.1 hypothetical protein B0B51_23235 [blood disease bacterium A2-HR MARDI]CCA83759.1 exported hypothetical protein [blood disease bacterium R229]
MNIGNFVAVIWLIASLSAYAVFCLWLWRKSGRIHETNCRCCGKPMEDDGCGIALLGGRFCQQCTTKILRK